MGPRTGVRQVVIAAAVVSGVLASAGQGPAAAGGPAPTTVSGSACGYYALARFGTGQLDLRGCGQPAVSSPNSAAPAVVTPPAGGTRTAADPDGATAFFGPAKLFSGQYPNLINDPNESLPSPRSGPMNVISQATVGANASVTSTATVDPGTQGTVDPTQPRGIGPGPVVADAVSATCTADQAGVGGSTSVTNGLVVTTTDETGAPLTTQPVPPSPPANLSVPGTITNVGDTFTAVFNEQIIGPDSITINAVHMYLLGPIVTGDLIIGQAVCSLAPSHVVADFTGDGRSDFSVYRPTDGSWWVNEGSNAFWGTAGDVPVPGDYDGDGDTEYAVYRPTTGAWYVLGGANAFWGTPGDIPVPADYDGDGDTDIAVFRPSNGAWYVLGGASVLWGAPGDVPVPGDYNADGKADFVVFRPSDSVWYLKVGLPDDMLGTDVIWGTPGDVPVPGDYDGDADIDVAVYRPSTGAWFVYGGTNALWGSPGDVPQPGDYDGDGDTDFATYQPASGRWAVAGGGAKLWGLPGDVPLVLPYAIYNSYFGLPLP